MVSTVSLNNNLIKSTYTENDSLVPPTAHTSTLRRALVSTHPLKATTTLLSATSNPKTPVIVIIIGLKIGATLTLVSYSLKNKLSEVSRGIFDNCFKGTN